MIQQLRGAFVVALLALYSAQGQSNEPAQIEVVVISSLHGLHSSNPNYSYDDLYDAIAEYQPDYLGVEIRPEDINQPSAWLKNYYPKEMSALRDKYPDITFGFDWLGATIEGTSIPDNYFATLEVLELSRALEADQARQALRPAQLTELQKQQRGYAATASLNELLTDDYGQLTRAIDELEWQWLGATRYTDILLFNQQRDHRIGRHIEKQLNSISRGRVVLVMGADHATFAREWITTVFGDRVRLVEQLPTIEQ